MAESTSERLLRNIERIMKEWETRALAEIKSASFQGKLALRDSLPEYLGQLAMALSKTINRTDARTKFDKAESTRVGKKHGKERSMSVNYTIDEMIFEYHILRQVLCDVMEEEVALTDYELELIVCSIEQAVNDAATEYSDSLSNLNSQLNEEKNLRDKFVASLSHDLRTPLTTIKMIAQMLSKKNQTQEDIQNTSERIIRSVDRVDTMIQDLLDFTHFGVGEKLPFNPKICRVNNVVQAAIDGLTTIHGKRFQFVASEQFDVLCDPSAITRIIENLGTNAVKYGLKSAPITVKLERQEKYLNISMHNLGPPINPDELDTIFEPFKRTASAQQGTQKGWGIGLPLIKGLAEAHDGLAKVESNAKGTTFTVSLLIDSPPYKPLGNRIPQQSTRPDL